MHNIIRIEYAAQLAVSMVALYLLPVELSWWAWPLLFLAPDLAIAGYLGGARAGAWCYNVAHHFGSAAVLIIAGIAMQQHWMILAGLIVWGHSSFDRLLGYGLKYDDSFRHTHQGWIGKGEQAAQG
jgi:hypothetical protein